MAAHGNLAVLGSPAVNLAGPISSGAVAIFRRQGAAWTQEALLLPPLPSLGSAFGISVAVHEERVVVGATGAQGAARGTGAAYIYERVAQDWQWVATLSAEDGLPADLFGRAVAVWADLVLVGAPGRDEVAWQSGAAYVFERKAGGWQQVDKLLPSTAFWNDVFGAAVTLHGATAAVSAPKDDTAFPADPNFDSGAIFVFERTPQGWIETAKLLDSKAAFDDLFGLTLHMDADLLAAGTSADGPTGLNLGRVVLYRRDRKDTDILLDDTWDEVAHLQPADAQPGDLFGSSVAVQGQRVIAGAVGQGEAGPMAGAAYVFERSSPFAEDWRMVHKLLPSGPGGRAGSAVAQSGGIVLVASPMSADFGPLAGRVDSFCFERLVHVRAGALGQSTGASWADAYPHLQHALLRAMPGDEIRVAAGIYRPDQGLGQVPGDRHATFRLHSGVRLIGGFAGHAAELPERPLGPTGGAGLVEDQLAILCGDLLGDDGPNFENTAENSIHVLIGDNVDRTALLEGFVIRRGNADAGLGPLDSGGGLSNRFGSPTVRHCRFEANSAGDFGNGGGAVHNRGNKAFYMHCDFVGNRNVLLGGGALWNQNSDVTLVNCRFFGNLAPVGFGGAIASRSSRLVLVNCVFSGNLAGKRGGAVYQLGASNALLQQCTLSGNDAGHQGGGLAAEGSSEVATVYNSILWGNTDGGSDPERAQISGGTVYAQHSLVEGWSGQLPGFAVIDSDPRFRAALGPDGQAGTLDDDLRLLTGSPASDAGSDSSIPKDTADLDGDGNTSEPLPLDAAGLPRRVLDPMASPGPPPANWVDLGAYERVALHGAPRALSLGAGGTQALHLDADPQHAGLLFVLLGSSQGMHPGLDLGAVHLPLVADDYFWWTASLPPGGPLSPPFGILDADGAAQARFFLPGGLPATLSGVRLQHAFLALQLPAGTPVFSSNAEVVELVP